MLLIVAYAHYVAAKTIVRLVLGLTLRLILKLTVRLIRGLTAGADQNHLQSSYFLECLTTKNRRHVFVRIVSGHLLMQVLMKGRWGGYGTNLVKII